MQPELELPYAWRKDKQFCRLVEVELRKIEQEQQTNRAAGKTEKMKPRLIKREQK